MVKLRTLAFASASFVGALVFFQVSAHGQTTALPELNRKVLRFAQAHKGKQVGNGECWTLAADALSHAGARRPGVNGMPLYVFGRRLGSGQAILPGDVVQFEKVKLVHKSPSGTSWDSMPHHTAVVASVAGKNITLLHQNYAHKKTVGTITISLNDRTEGSIVFYRPLPVRK